MQVSYIWVLEKDIQACFYLSLSLLHIMYFTLVLYFDLFTENISIGANVS